MEVIIVKENKYILGIKFNGCDKETEKFCIWKRKYGKCEDALNNCQYPITANPLCFCPSTDLCAGRYTIKKKGKDIYILYSCHMGCQYFMKNYETTAPKLLKTLDKDNIYYGKALDKLVKDLFKNDKKKMKVSEDEDIVKFFDKLFTSLSIS